MKTIIISAAVEAFPITHTVQSQLVQAQRFGTRASLIGAREHAQRIIEHIDAALGEADAVVPAEAGA